MNHDYLNDEPGDAESVPEGGAAPVVAPISLSATLAQTLRLAGFEPGDFEITEGAPEGLRSLGLPDRLLTVHRRSTGHRQLYATSPGCPWLFNAFADLTAGRFGEPARRVS